MNIDGAPYRTIWLEADRRTVAIIDQTELPHRLVVAHLTDLAAACHAIRAMQVRGAPLIGVAAAFGLALGLAADASDAGLEHAAAALLATRPTAVNLRWALDAAGAVLRPLPAAERAPRAFALAEAAAEADVADNHAIGRHGASVIAALARRHPGRAVEILTHCNAGWLAAVDWGTALAPIYAAQEQGIALHVWVGETRPRNQGAFLTAWELAAAGVPHTVIVDNAGGHLMQKGRVDLALVGSDRTAANGDVANKIGTYLKALAARDTGVPFYAVLPSSTIDWTLADGGMIPIEERDGEEVSHIAGVTADGRRQTVRLTPERSAVANPAFDVTPARLVTGLITERGVCAASRDGLRGLFPDYDGAAA